MQKIPKNSKILKNDGHFRIPHPQISLKQFSNICENVVYFFYYVGGWKNDNAFQQNKKFKKIKNCQFSFFDILQLFCKLKIFFILSKLMLTFRYDEFVLKLLLFFSITVLLIGLSIHFICSKKDIFSINKSGVLALFLKCKY